MTSARWTIRNEASQEKVAARRPGYREDVRTVTIEDGAEAEVRFDLQRDPSPPADAVAAPTALAAPERLSCQVGCAVAE